MIVAWKPLHQMYRVFLQSLMSAWHCSQVVQVELVIAQIKATMIQGFLMYAASLFVLFKAMFKRYFSSIGPVKTLAPKFRCRMWKRWSAQSYMPLRELFTLKVQGHRNKEAMVAHHVNLSRQTV
jgi:hypothetical protein